MDARESAGGRCTSVSSLGMLRRASTCCWAPRRRDAHALHDDASPQWLSRGEAVRGVGDTRGVLDALETWSPCRAPDHDLSCAAGCALRAAALEAATCVGCDVEALMIVLL